MNIERAVAQVMRDKLVAGAVVDLIEELLTSVDVSIDQITDILDTDRMPEDFLREWFNFYGVEFYYADNGQIDRNAARRYRALLRKRGELSAIGSVLVSGGGLFTREPIEADLWHWHKVPSYVETAPRDGIIYVRTSNTDILWKSDLINKVTPAGYKFLVTIVRTVQYVNAMANLYPIWLNKLWYRPIEGWKDPEVGDLQTLRSMHIPVITRPSFSHKFWSPTGAYKEGQTFGRLYPRTNGYLDKYFNIQILNTRFWYLDLIEYLVKVTRETLSKKQAPILSLEPRRDIKLHQSGCTDIPLYVERSLMNPQWNITGATKNGYTLEMIQKEIQGYLGQYFNIQTMSKLFHFADILDATSSISNQIYRLHKTPTLNADPDVSYFYVKGFCRPVEFPKATSDRWSITTLYRYGQDIKYLYNTPEYYIGDVRLFHTQQMLRDMGLIDYKTSASLQQTRVLPKERVDTNTITNLMQKIVHSDSGIADETSVAERTVKSYINRPLLNTETETHVSNTRYTDIPEIGTPWKISKFLSKGWSEKVISEVSVESSDRSLTTERSLAYNPNLTGVDQLSIKNHSVADQAQVLSGEKAVATERSLSHQVSVESSDRSLTTERSLEFPIPVGGKTQVSQKNGSSVSLNLSAKDINILYKREHGLTYKPTVTVPQSNRVTYGTLSALVEAGGVFSESIRPTGMASLSMSSEFRVLVTHPTNLEDKPETLGYPTVSFLWNLTGLYRANETLATRLKSGNVHPQIQVIST